MIPTAIRPTTSRREKELAEKGGFKRDGDVSSDLHVAVGT